MPVFDVLVNGKAIDLPSVEDPIIGFMTRRRIAARDIQAAIGKAKETVRQEWQDGGYQDRNRAAAPVLDVEMVEPLSVWRRLTTNAPRRGFTFYTELGGVEF